MVHDNLRSQTLMCMLSALLGLWVNAGKLEGFHDTQLIVDFNFKIFLVEKLRWRGSPWLANSSGSGFCKDTIYLVTESFPRRGLQDQDVVA